MKEIITLINNTNLYYFIEDYDNYFLLFLEKNEYRYMLYHPHTKTISIISYKLKRKIENLASEDQDNILKHIEEKINLKIKGFY